MNAASESGFSLIEVIAALGIFSIAALGLIKLNNETLRGAGHLSARAIAELEASSQMADAMTNPDMRAGSRSGSSVQRGKTLAWSTSISPTNVAKIKLIEVSISDPQSGQVYVRVQALKAGDE